MNKAYLRCSYNFFTEGALYSEYRERLPQMVDWFGIGRKALSQDDAVEQDYLAPRSNSWFHLANCKVNDHLVICTLYNITSEKIKDTQLKFMESTDMLSGLPNRSSFYRELESCFEQAEAAERAFGIAIIHLNDIHAINDVNGREAGDAEIKKCAKLLLNFDSRDITSFRFGDNEFAVLRREVKSKSDMAELAESIIAGFSKEQVRVSMGIALYPEDDTQASNLMKYADLAMHSVLNENKAGYMFFSPEMYTDFLDKIQFKDKVLAGIKNNRFELYYQPQFNIASRTLRGFEALLRWHDGASGMRRPDDFIPAAEETHVIVPLGNWVLETALKTLRMWQTDYNFDGIMSVNVSPAQLKTPGFVQDLKEKIGRSGIKKGTLEIEITEGMFISEKEKTSALLQDIRGMGVLISLDDFGTGYASLQYLNTLPITTLKVDKSFISKLEKKDDLGTTIMRSIVSSVSDHGMETIAEGVEHDEQVSILKELNCSNIQGFLWGKPMPQKSCEEFLRGDFKALDHLEGGNISGLRLHKEGR